MNRLHLAYRPMNLLVALVMASILGGCQSQPEQPPARYGARVVFDPVTGRTLLFGGRAEGSLGSKYLNDLWAFDALALAWTPITTSPRPPARLSPGMVYDPLQHQIILFGGHGARDRLGDTWAYSIADNRWQEITPANSPPARSDAGMAYDEQNHVVILFGGYCREDSRELCDDTWAYDPETMTWTEKSPEPSPPLMYGHTLVYDAPNHRSLLWGGHMSAIRHGQRASIGYGNSVWRYDYLENRWQGTEATPSGSPPARYWHQAAFDLADGYLFLFGGDGGRGFLADTWLYKVTSDTWQRVRTEVSPSPRINSAIAYDAIHEKVILFGGLEEGNQDLQDTWVFEKTENGGEWSNVLPH